MDPTAYKILMTKNVTAVSLTFALSCGIIITLSASELSEQSDGEGGGTLGIYYIIRSLCCGKCGWLLHLQVVRQR